MLTAAVVADGTSDWVPVPRADRVWLPRRPLQDGQPGETAGVGTSPLAAEVVPLLPAPFVDGTLLDIATWVVVADGTSDWVPWRPGWTGGSNRLLMQTHA